MVYIARLHLQQPEELSMHCRPSLSKYRLPVRNRIEIRRRDRKRSSLIAFFFRHVTLYSNQTIRWTANLTICHRAAIAAATVSV